MEALFIIIVIGLIVYSTKTPDQVPEVTKVYILVEEPKQPSDLGCLPALVIATLVILAAWLL